jgi:hypothetical protein
MEMAGFRVGSLASLLVFGGASIAAAQSPVFTRTSQIIDDNGKGVDYTPNTSYVRWNGFLGTTLNCCPELGGLFPCEFTVKSSAGGTVDTSTAQQGIPTSQTVPITSGHVDTFQGPSQYTVTLTGRCYLEIGGHFYLPNHFITSYSLIVEKPN